MGHDVETGWLLCEAARTLENQDLIKRTNLLALDVTGACLAEGMSDKDVYKRQGYDERYDYRFGRKLLFAVSRRLYAESQLHRLSDKDR